MSESNFFQLKRSIDELKSLDIVNPIQEYFLQLQEDAKQVPVLNQEIASLKNSLKMLRGQNHMLMSKLDLCKKEYLKEVKRRSKLEKELNSMRENSSFLLEKGRNFLKVLSDYPKLIDQLESEVGSESIFLNCIQKNQLEKPFEVLINIVNSCISRQINHKRKNSYPPIDSKYELIRNLANQNAQLAHINHRLYTDWSDTPLKKKLR